MEYDLEQYDPKVSKSLSPEPHRFFEYTLNNDLDSLVKELLVRYDQIANKEIAGVTDVTEKDIFLDSNSVSTIKWSQYNVFQFNIPGVRSLFSAVSKMVQEASEYYNKNFEDQQYMVQGWFNVNYTKNGKLPWHDHSPQGAPLFHGYYSVSAEPSETHYFANGDHKVNHNVNNKAIMSEMGHSHAMGEWDWEGPRITIAYDIVPLSYLIENEVEEQHWIPLN
tara:strand:+ start:1301 stop:1966 length:666 start_codon:yes stop_codon:yes gene_type:complete